MAFVLTPGQRYETTAFKRLMDQEAVWRLARGRPKMCPYRVSDDKAYGSGQIRRDLCRRGIRTTTIPRKKNEHRGGPFDREIYRTRNRRIERLINCLKQYRRVATRYEKRAENYQAMLNIASLMLWL